MVGLLTVGETWARVVASFVARLRLAENAAPFLLGAYARASTQGKVAL